VDEVHALFMRLRCSKRYAAVFFTTKQALLWLWRGALWTLCFRLRDLEAGSPAVFIKDLFPNCPFWRNSRQYSMIYHPPILSAYAITYLLLVTVTGWYRTKRPLQLRPFYIYCASPSEFYHSRYIHQNYFLRLQQTDLVGKRGESGWEMAAEFCLSLSVS
jgi:hypothetical protein